MKSITVSILVIWAVIGANATYSSVLKKSLQPELSPHHEAMAELAKRVPGFGGLFLDNEGTRLNIYLLDPSLKAVAVAAITEVLGATQLRDVDLASPENERVHQGQYDYLALIEWNNRMMNVLALPGVSYKGISDADNRLIIGLEDEKARSQVEETLEQLGIPREAVIIKVTGPVKQLSHTVQSHIRPTVGGLKIAASSFERDVAPDSF